MCGAVTLTLFGKPSQSSASHYTTLLYHASKPKNSAIVAATYAARRVVVGDPTLMPSPEVKLITPYHTLKPSKFVGGDLGGDCS